MLVEQFYVQEHKHNINRETIFSGSGITIDKLPSWLPKAEFSRTQSDLVAKFSDNEIVFIDYFSSFEAANLLTQNGLLLKHTLIKALAGPIAKSQFVQDGESPILSIGEVSSISGTVKALRTDGSSSNLNSGDPVFQGDTIETVGNGTVGLTFIDKTTLSLSEGGKMVLDELVFDPASETGSMAFDMLEGAFSFVSGEIAKTGPDSMKITTPVATIGIRGTTVAGKAAVEGNENSFTLLQDADGAVGQISVSNAGGTQVLAQVGATTSISSFTVPPPPPIILSAAEIQANYGTALNVLPPTPTVAPQPQPAPPPQEEQQEEQQIQEENQDEETEEVVDEESVIEDELEGELEEELSEASEDELLEDELVEGEDGLSEEENVPEGDITGPDGEPLSEEDGEIPSGSDGEPLLTEEDGPPVGPDGEPLSEAPVGPDGEPLPPGELGVDGPTPEQDAAAREAFQQALEDGASPEEAMAAAAAAGGFDAPPFGGPLAPTPEQDAAAREAFETALASGLSPEEAMAEAAEAAGIPAPPGGFGADPLGSTIGGDTFAGGPNFGPGGPDDFSPVDNLFGGPDEFGDTQFGGPLDDPGIGSDIFGGPDPFGGPDGGFGNPIGGTGIELGGPGYLDGPMEFGDPNIGMPGGETEFGSGFGGPGGIVPNQFLGAQPPGAATFAPIGPAILSGPGGVFGDPYGGAVGGFGDPFGGPGGGFGDPFGGPGGGFGDPFGSGFGDPFGGPVGEFGGPAGEFGPGGFIQGGFGAGFYDPYGGFVENEFYQEEYFDDPSLYNDYYNDPYFESSGSGSSGTSNNFNGTSSADSEDKSSETDSWQFNGYSGDDTFIGGSGDDTFWGAIGNDTLTGNLGIDTFYYSDNTEGTDTINDFSSTDILKFAQPFSGSYSRSDFFSDSGVSGSTYDISASSSLLPKVFNFTEDNPSYASASGIANFLSGLLITIDGSNPISSSESFILVSGNGANSAVYGWTDSGDGEVSSTELFSLAILDNTDNDTLSSSNFAFGTI